jgi:stage II sporulation protein AA (anti-sigma F factor antagonist)
MAIAHVLHDGLMLDRRGLEIGVTMSQPAASAAAPGGSDELLQFRFARDGTTETLYVSGELDISSAPSFEQAAAGALDGQGGAFRVDLGGLTFMDSTGARALVRVHERVEGIGRDLVVMHPTRPVRRVLELLGLDRLISVEH